MKANLVPAIEKPCPVKWESMVGDEKRRYCEHCQLHVHNLSAMTANERNEVLAPSPERKCISYLHRADANAPKGKAQLTLQSLSWLPRWLAAIIALFITSCDECGRTTGEIVRSPSSKKETPPPASHTDTAP
jgi:predicted Fe-S protein YdhL (DUF1289 family)